MQRVGECTAAGLAAELKEGPVRVSSVPCFPSAPSLAWRVPSGAEAEQRRCGSVMDKAILAESASRPGVRGAAWWSRPRSWSDPLLRAWPAGGASGACDPQPPLYGARGPRTPYRAPFLAGKRQPIRKTRQAATATLFSDPLRVTRVGLVRLQCRACRP